MKSITSLFLVLLLTVNYPAFAQQDPDDPGIYLNTVVAATLDSLPPSGLANDDCSKLPNPFCCDCKICFFIASPQWIQIKVFSLRGEEVLSDTTYFESGKHSMVWCPSERTQGIYFYKLIAHDRIITGKLKQGD